MACRQAGSQNKIQVQLKNMENMILFFINKKLIDCFFIYLMKNQKHLQVLTTTSYVQVKQIFDVKRSTVNIVKYS